MTQQEFTDRTGLTLSANEFERIHELYMECSYSKDEFCADYMKIRDSIILEDLYVSLFTLKEEKEQIETRMKELAHFLIRKSIAYNDITFYKEAIKIIGVKSAILYRLENDLPLAEEDKTYLTIHLGNTSYENIS